MLARMALKRQAGHRGLGYELDRKSARRGGRLPVGDTVFLSVGAVTRIIQADNRHPTVLDDRRLPGAGCRGPLMTDHTALTRLAKAVVADMASERLSAATQRAMHDLDEAPEHVFDLVDLLAKEGKKGAPVISLIGGYAFLLAHGLEMLRYAVDREDAATMALVDRLRRHLIEAGEKGALPRPCSCWSCTSSHLPSSKMGDDLRSLMQRLMENDGATRAAVKGGEAADHFARMAEQLGGDPFAIHACLDETIEAMPEDARAGLVMAAFAENEPAISEAVVGFLLHASTEVRGKLAELLELAAPHGLVTPMMLRRMIAMRNWLPSSDRKRSRQGDQGRSPGSHRVRVLAATRGAAGSVLLHRRVRCIHRF